MVQEHLAPFQPKQTQISQKIPAELCVWHTSSNYSATGGQTPAEHITPTSTHGFVSDTLTACTSIHTPSTWCVMICRTPRNTLWKKTSSTSLNSFLLVHPGLWITAATTFSSLSLWIKLYSQTHIHTHTHSYLPLCFSITAWKCSHTPLWQTICGLKNTSLLCVSVCWRVWDNFTKK